MLDQGNKISLKGNGACGQVCRALDSRSKVWSSIPNDIMYRSVGQTSFHTASSYSTVMGTQWGETAKLWLAIAAAKSANAEFSPEYMTLWKSAFQYQGCEHVQSTKFTGISGL